MKTPFRDFAAIDRPSVKAYPVHGRMDFEVYETRSVLG